MQEARQPPTSSDDDRQQRLRSENGRTANRTTSRSFSELPSDVERGTPDRGQSEPEPLTMNLPELARVLSISRATCYYLAAQGRLPVRVIRIGRRLVVSRFEVDRLLGRGSDN